MMSAALLPLPWEDVGQHEELMLFLLGRNQFCAYCKSNSFFASASPVPCKNISVFQAGCHFLCCQDSGTCLSISSVHFVAVTNSGQTHPFSPSISVTITTSLSFVMTQINTVLTHLFLLSFASILSLFCTFVQKQNSEAASSGNGSNVGCCDKKTWILNLFFCTHWLAWVTQLPPARVVRI